MARVDTETAREIVGLWAKRSIGPAALSRIYGVKLRTIEAWIRGESRYEEFKDLLAQRDR